MLCLEITLFECMLNSMICVTYSHGNSSQPIWFSNFFCGHTDMTCIGYCQSCPTQQSTGCVHSEDMTVQCSMLSYIQLYILYIIIPHILCSV